MLEKRSSEAMLLDDLQQFASVQSTPDQRDCKVTIINQMDPFSGNKPDRYEERRKKLTSAARQASEPEDDNIREEIKDEDLDLFSPINLL